MKSLKSDNSNKSYRAVVLLPCCPSTNLIRFLHWHLPARFSGRVDGFISKTESFSRTCQNQTKDTFNAAKWINPGLAGDHRSPKYIGELTAKAQGRQVATGHQDTQDGEQRKYTFQSTTKAQMSLVKNLGILTNSNGSALLVLFCC